jgi:hypothetical protein
MGSGNEEIVRIATEAIACVTVTKGLSATAATELYAIQQAISFLTALPRVLKFLQFNAKELPR